MTGRRELTLAVGLCALGAALVLFAEARPWLEWRDLQSLTAAGVHLTLSGRKVSSSASALAWVAAAGAVALIATRGMTRALLGGLLALAGVGILLVDLDWLTGVTPASVDGMRISSPHRVITWPVVSMIGGAVILAGGLLAAVRGRSWSGMGSSYEAPGGEPEPPVTEKGVWDALDRGDDPTA
jgi:uncharacterized membrane protein (TIGR02234 family)